MPDFTQVLQCIILSCIRKPPTLSQTSDGDASSLEMAEYLRVRRAVCLLLWEGETLSEEVSDADRAGAASSARILGCQQGGAKSAQ